MSPHASASDGRAAGMRPRGVLDADLVGALVLYGAEPIEAGAAVIAYHAIALWVPSIGGLLAYARLRPRLAAH